MRHWAYSLRSDGRSPAGEAGSWFRWYKFDIEPTEQDVFVPACIDEYEEAKAGDKLWFVVDNQVIGCATISRRETNFCLGVGDQTELYFDAVTIGRWPDGPVARWAMEQREVPADVGNGWFKELRRKILADRTAAAATAPKAEKHEMSKADIERLRERSQRAGNR